MADQKQAKNLVAEPTDLHAQLTTKRAELLEARKNLGSTLQNPHIIQQHRKDIARILTQINAKPTKGK